MTSTGPEAPAREPMSPADAAWLQMEHPTNRMIITSLMTFDRPLDADSLQRTLERLAAVPRFHHRVVSSGILPALPEWREDPRFDLRAHVHHLGGPAPGGDAGLRQLVSERMSMQLDPEKALWELDVIDAGGGPTALLLRVHHCLGDGVALVRVLLGLADEAGPVAPDVRARRQDTPGPLEWAGRQLVRARTFVELVALPEDPPTAFRRPVGLVKRAAWSEPIPVARLRALAREHQATVNDVLMATLAGALRDWLVGAGRPLPDRDIRALVPVFLGSRNGEMGNRFGLAFVGLPIGEQDAAARIRALKRSMDAVKSSVVAPVAFDILRLFGVAGRFVEQLGVEIFTRKATLMVTNVPGPKTRVRLAGGELSSVMVWAPTSGRMGLSATLLSYGGELRIGIAVDANLDLDPEALVREYERALAPPRAAARPEAQPAA
jgi:hypothetical protein